MNRIAHLLILFGVLISPFHTKGFESSTKNQGSETTKDNITNVNAQQNVTTSAKFEHVVLPVGGKCKNDGDCKPGLKCCDAMGGNKCWECCEDVHCEGMGKICWYESFQDLTILQMIILRDKR